MKELEKPKMSDLAKIVKESPRKKCACGSEYFDTVTTQVEISAIRSPSGKDEILLVGVLVCRKCGVENQQNKIIT